MSTYTTTTCRSCRARIRFVPTVTDRLMPLDAEPNPDGNVEIHDGHAVVLEQPTIFDTGERWMPHWASCPDAEQWRKR